MLYVEVNSAWQSLRRKLSSIVLSTCEHLLRHDQVKLIRGKVEEHLLLAGLRFFSDRHISVLCADQKVLNCIKQRASSVQLAKAG